MTKVPFHRRVFLWVFILAFVVLAPAAVFYTAGYRWNAKKGIIERNGTLILGTLPVGAEVILNGLRTGDHTPVTLQNVAPGTYRIRLEHAGYLPWEKTLDVRPERVTFVSDVRLWPDQPPSLEEEGDIHAVSASPDAETLAFVTRASDMTRVTFRDIQETRALPAGDVSATFDDVAPTGRIHVLWNPASSAVLIRDEQGEQWVAQRTQPQAPVLLPRGAYRWDGTTLIGVLAGTAGKMVERFEYSSTNGQVRRSPLAPGVEDEDGLYRIVSATGSARLLVEERRNPARRFELPNGRWTIAERIGDRLFMTNGSVWFGFDPSQASPSPVTLPASEPPASIRRDRDTLLLSHEGGELWADVLGREPELLVRSSSALTGAGWYRDATQAFYATADSVVAVGLDPRDGRLQTKLASFDAISSMTVARTSLFVSGARDGVRGLWEISIE